MPKTPPQDKKSIPKKRTRAASRFGGARSRVAPQSLGGIMQSGGWLQALQQTRATQQGWLDWLRAALPDELRAAVINVVRKGDELTVLAASASWSARLRFAVAALVPQVEARAPEITAVKVRVAPAGRREP